MPALTLHHRFWPQGQPFSLDYPQRSLYANLLESARRQPGHPMLVFYGATISYGEGLAIVDRMAGFLQRECGVGRGDRVLLYTQNCPQWILSYYAILRADAMVVPVNPMLLDDEVGHIASDSGARVAFAAEELAAHVVPAALDHVVLIRYRDCIGDPPAPRTPAAVLAEPLDGAPGLAALSNAMPATRIVRWSDALAAGLDPAPALAGPDDLAVLPYSSGTTGKPKGCIHTHRTAMATAYMHLRWSDWGEAPVILATLPLFHVTGMQSNMNAPILVGATIVMIQRWDREAAADLIESMKITSWTCITTMATDLLSMPGIEQRDLSSLRRLGGGGAAMPAAVAARLKTLTGLEYIEGYGMTETIAPTHLNPNARPKRQCAGVPLFDVDARVIDPDTLVERGVGESGEIVVHAPQVFLGYWNNPRATEEAFIEIEGKRFLRTGDIGHYDDEGYFFITDRLKRMINAAGYKVWPAEVEAMMYAHPDIREACVIAARDERRGETVKAIVVLRPERRDQVSAGDIAAWCRERMAAYKAPRIVEIVDSLPRSASGKIMWRELQERELRAVPGRR
jgi:fatty-acyl-CoA synthase